MVKSSEGVIKHVGTTTKTEKALHDLLLESVNENDDVTNETYYSQWDCQK